MCTDLGNNAAPATAVKATLHPKAFKRWMVACGYDTVDESNTGQVVVMLYKGASTTVKNITFTPNWHITAMTDRMKFQCNNFHFKIEATKAIAHYWHYVLFYDAAAGTWHFVGDPNPQIKGRNDAGGGAAANAKALDANRTLVNNVATVNGLANQVTIATQNAMLATLNKMTEDGLVFEKNNIWQ